MNQVKLRILAVSALLLIAAMFSCSSPHDVGTPYKKVYSTGQYAVTVSAGAALACVKIKVDPAKRTVTEDCVCVNMCGVPRVTRKADCTAKNWDFNARTVDLECKCTFSCKFPKGDYGGNEMYSEMPKEQMMEHMHEKPHDMMQEPHKEMHHEAMHDMHMEKPHEHMHDNMMDGGMGDMSSEMPHDMMSDGGMSDGMVDGGSGDMMSDAGPIDQKPENGPEPVMEEPMSEPMPEPKPEPMPDNGCMNGYTKGADGNCYPVPTDITGHNGNEPCVVVWKEYGGNDYIYYWCNSFTAQPTHAWFRCMNNALCTTNWNTNIQPVTTIMTSGKTIVVVKKPSGWDEAHFFNDPNHKKGMPWSTQWMDPSVTKLVGVCKKTWTANTWMHKCP